MWFIESQSGTSSLVVSYVSSSKGSWNAEPEASTDDLIEQLKKLGELKEAGVLDDAEFQVAKAKLLADM